MKTIQIKGTSLMDADIRLNALSQINSYDTQTLTTITKLLKQEKTRTKFKNKAHILAKFI